VVYNVVKESTMENQFVVLSDGKSIWIEPIHTLLNDDLFENKVEGWFRYRSEAENKVHSVLYNNKRLKYIRG
jgi:hypothetical protein